jgi:hypothetical protein
MHILFRRRRRSHLFQRPRERFFPNGVCVHESAKAPLLFPFVPLCAFALFPRMSRAYVFILYDMTTKLNEL